MDCTAWQPDEGADGGGGGAQTSRLYRSSIRKPGGGNPIGMVHALKEKSQTGCWFLHFPLVIQHLGTVM